MTRKKLLWATLLIPLLAITMISSVKSNAGSTNVSIEPGVIWNLNMGPYTQFTVDLEVDYVELLWSYQFELGKALFAIPGWNPSVLRLLSVDNGPFLGSAGGRVVFFPGTIDNTVGTLTLTCAGLDPNRRWPTGGGVLATLTFEVVGYGTSPIHFGMDSALLNRSGGYELGPYWEPLRGTLNPNFLHDGFFSNVQGPELYIRTRGAHGGGVWPEWQVNLPEVEQTLYSKIMNYGEEGAWVKVLMTVISPSYGTETYETNEAWCPAAYWTPQGEIVPGEVTVSVAFTPPGVERYTINGALYFKVVGMSDFAPYQLVIDGGGEGVALSRDPGEGYKVVVKI